MKATNKAITFLYFFFKVINACVKKLMYKANIV